MRLFLFIAATSAVMVVGAQLVCWLPGYEPGGWFYTAAFIGFLQGVVGMLLWAFYHHGKQ